MINMVSLEINKTTLLKLIGKELTDEELIDILFNFKCEATIVGDSINCEITPDRLDLFSVEGIARAIKQFLEIEPGLQKIPIMPSTETIYVKNVKARPHIRAAIIRNMIFDEAFILDLMQIQEKLHATIGRDRKKVAIGIHDISKVQGPFTYKEVFPNEIRFMPLDMKKEMNLKEILEEHPKGKKYANLLKDFNMYPILLDAKERVLSFPPIINGELTRVSLETKDILIDVTGTDEKAVENTLNIIVSMLSFRGGIVEAVKISSDDFTKEFPSFEPKLIKIKKELPEMILGTKLNLDDIPIFLERMGYDAAIVGDSIEIFIPAYRVDVFSEMDIIEDIAIAYGYNNIIPELPKLATKGEFSKKEKISKKIRTVMIGFGAQETLNFILTNENDCYTKMHVVPENYIKIKNPVSSEFNICRTWILPSLMKILSLNKHRSYPQKIFEVSDCIVPDNTQETKARNSRKLGFVVCHETANLTEMKSYVEAFLSAFKIKYEIIKFEHPSFIPTRVGAIICNGENVGFFGEIHPKVLEKWELDKPVIAMEIDLDKIF